jgi:hypothetical protein
MKPLVVMLAFVCAATTAQAQTFSAKDLARSQRRAIEAVNWGMSAVNFDRASTDLRSPFVRH